jgi:hypothetical protein
MALSTLSTVAKVGKSGLDLAASIKAGDYFHASTAALAPVPVIGVAVGVFTLAETIAGLLKSKPSIESQFIAARMHDGTVEYREDTKPPIAYAGRHPWIRFVQFDYQTGNIYLSKAGLPSYTWEPLFNFLPFVVLDPSRSVSVSKGKIVTTNTGYEAPEIAWHWLKHLKTGLWHRVFKSGVSAEHSSTARPSGGLLAHAVPKVSLQNMFETFASGDQLGPFDGTTDGYVNDEFGIGKSRGRWWYYEKHGYSEKHVTQQKALAKRIREDMTERYSQRYFTLPPNNRFAMAGMPYADTLPKSVEERQFNRIENIPLPDGTYLTIYGRWNSRGGKRMVSGWYSGIVGERKWTFNDDTASNNAIRNMADFYEMKANPKRLAAEQKRRTDAMVKLLTKYAEMGVDDATEGTVKKEPLTSEDVNVFEGYSGDSNGEKYLRQAYSMGVKAGTPVQVPVSTQIAAQQLVADLAPSAAAAAGVSTTSSLSGGTSDAPVLGSSGTGSVSADLPGFIGSVWTALVDFFSPSYGNLSNPSTWTPSSPPVSTSGVGSSAQTQPVSSAPATQFGAEPSPATSSPAAPAPQTGQPAHVPAPGQPASTPAMAPTTVTSWLVMAGILFLGLLFLVLGRKK